MLANINSYLEINTVAEKYDFDSNKWDTFRKLLGLEIPTAALSLDINNDVNIAIDNFTTYVNNAIKLTFVKTTNKPMHMLIPEHIRNKIKNKHRYRRLWKTYHNTIYKYIYNNYSKVVKNAIKEWRNEY